MDTSDSNLEQPEVEPVAQEGEPPAFSFDSLEAVRRKLLDLSGRNPLLHYKHPQSNCIRLIDELPDQVFSDLQNDKSFCFIPVPAPTEHELIDTGYIVKDPITKAITKQDYPTAIQWAKYRNLSVSFDLPSKATAEQRLSHHQDNNLQTLLFAPELESRLRSIRVKAETALEEAGANVLYLVLGFLEWYESADSTLARHAPLFTVPVQLERGKLNSREGIYSYTIKQKDDGYLTNVTLREKLTNDFGLVLPGIDEESSPEAYFETIESTLLKYQPRWKIKRQATLSLLDFAKQVMYEDLNPANWPSHKNISDHPIIKQFFSASVQSESSVSTSYAPLHPIDDIESVHEKFPLIYDADSSQHSAIIDAVRGNNLVIEGPPGTGKSQTITNLIAAAIANGKRVLFVAEKMAALEVVKGRLDKAGLGDFCLELHSHKSNKLQVLSDLNRRLKKQGTYRAPQEIATDIARYESLKIKLNQYVQFINEPWRNTGLTLHQILTGAVRYREEVDISIDHLQIANLTGKNFTPIRFRELQDNTAMLSDIYEQVAKQAADTDIVNHYWYGVKKIDLVAYQGPELALRLREWNRQLGTLAKGWSRFLAATNQPTTDTTIALISETSKTLAYLPDISGEEPLALLAYIAHEPVLFDDFIAEYKAIHRDNDRLGRVFKLELFQDAEQQKNVTTALNNLVELDVATDCHLVGLAKDLEDIKSQMSVLKEINMVFEAMRPQIPVALHACTSTTKRGLKEFITLIDMVGRLPSNLWRYRNEIYDNVDLDNVISSLTIHLSRITPLHKLLIDSFSLHRLPDTQSLKHFKATLDSQGLFRIFSAEWRNAKKSILSFAASAKPNTKEIVSLLPQLIEYRTELDSIERINSEDNFLGDIYKGVDTPIDRITSLRKWYKAVRQEYGIGFGERVELGNALLNLDRGIAASLNEARLQELANKATKLIAYIEAYSGKFSAVKPYLSDSAELCSEQSSLGRLADIINTSLLVLKPFVIGVQTPLEKLTADMSLLVTMSDRAKIWHESFFGKHLPNNFLSMLPGNYSEKNVAALESTAALANYLKDHPTLIHLIAHTKDYESYKQIKAEACSLVSQLSACQVSQIHFAEYGDVDLDEWTKSSNDDVVALIARNESAVDNPTWLNTWLEYLRVKLKLTQQGLGAIISNLEDCKFSPQLLIVVCKQVVYSQLAKEALGEHSHLALFSGMEHGAIRNQFQDYDKKLLNLQRELVANKASARSPLQGVFHGKVSDYTEISLIRHETGKKTRHIPVRKLLKRANESIRILKPCFMMSPMSVAQYLTPGEFEFDLVVMDEASQIRPEDALGAIARGNTLIVVGDPKQLPPTSFFQRSINNEEGDDVVAAERSESILETVAPMFRNRQLLWHYRSKHESLIAFSNKHFYDNNLVIFPSPFQKTSEFGVILHKINKGRFVSRRNSEEARRIVLKVAELMLNQQNDSIGIVAMSAEQRDEIEKQLEQYLKDNPLALEAYEQNRASIDPLFVKNLENVQGDERDIILISMTYGPEQIGGRTMQRFGPINSDVGGRRLNVLFTRSKKQMHIFSSMDSSDVLISNTSSRGSRALRAFLEYCETQHLHNTEHTGKFPDSDFEVSVIRALENHGYQCEPQLGTAGYLLDIAVRDPGNPGRFLMAIECDGASYHSAKSARDRDRLRQDILENLGWRIKRIWSTDWFSNPEAQLAPILSELNQLKSESPILEKPEPVDELESGSEAKSAPSKNIGIDDQPDGLQLRQRLIDFNNHIIITEQPDTPDEGRLLRPAMLESLLHFLPTSKSEFIEFIPPYLRDGTSSKEGKYLDHVLELVADYG